MDVNSLLKSVDDLVWGIPLIVLILLVGCFLTVRLRGLQIRRLPLAVRNLISDDSAGEDLVVCESACILLCQADGHGRLPVSGDEIHRGSHGI